MLPGESTPVLLTLLRDASRTPAVSTLIHETQWRGDTPRLHVLDQSTWQSLQRLSEIGLISFNTRATRHLSGEQPAPAPRPSLTPEQVRRIADLRAFAAKKAEGRQTAHRRRSGGRSRPASTSRPKSPGAGGQH